ncbi:MAG: helix-turn-helix domain-containing protein [Niveispirillum sp.]|uniref:helix-turn-helix domain-containing protein n=1 Tax=Niveispirillum sp. TaxID=1917217 RepID=UPI0006B9CFD7
MTNSIAARLRLLRHRLGFARRSDMAAHLGLPSSTYSAYEGDAGPPKVEWLLELARRGVNLNWLLTGEGEMLVPGQDVASMNPTIISLSTAAASTPSLRPHPVGEPEPVVDAYLLAAMISRVEREERDRGRALSALEKGEMIAHLYVASARLTESELAGHPLSRAAEAPEK